MPNIPPEQQFKDDVQHVGYPCLERGGIIWTYMGLAKNLPELPDCEFLRVPDEHRIYRLFFQEANYLQVLEGASIRPMSCGCTRPTISQTKR